jgi:hypothetical protein
MEHNMIDSVFIELVPRIVDTNPQLFEDNTKYWGHAVEQVHEFLGRLPDNYKGKVSEHRFEDEKAAVFKCEGSPYDLMVGFKPAYHLLIVSPDDKRQAFTSDDCIACPTFDVAFKPTDKEGARRILSAGLEQFFLRQGDIDDGTLIAIGGKNGEVVYRDLPLLRTLLPLGTVVEARCDYGAGNAEATYRL